MKHRWVLPACILLAAAGYAAVLLVTGIGCPIRDLTGIPCPGCGMTRACIGLLLGDPAVPDEGLWGHVRYAMQFHPLVLVVPPALLYLLFGKKPLLGSAKRQWILIGALCGLMLAVWLVRLALRDPVLLG